MLFGCLGCAKKIITFRGPYVKLIFDRQTTDLLLKHGPQNEPHISQYGFLCSILFVMLLWNSVFMVLLPKSTATRYPESYLSQTSDLANV